MPFNPNTPRSRDEVLLQAIVSGDSTAIGDPRDREEEFVKAIADRTELPDAPTTDGGYMLKVTVTGGVPTYEWVPGDSSSDVFIAEYGTTTWAALTSAYNQNKAIFCRVNRGNGDYRIAPLNFISIGAAEFNYYRSPGTINSTNPSDEMLVYRLSTTGNVWATETRPVRGIITAGTGIAVTYADNKPVVSAT